MNLTKIVIQSVITLAKTLFKFVLPLVYVALGMFILIILNILYYRFIKGIKPKKNKNIVQSSEPGILKKLLVMFPRQVALDYLEQDPEDFSEFGINLACGEQGSGKTITLIYILEKLRRKYPDLIINTNMYYKYATNELNSVLDIIKYNNGKKGVVNALDELPTMLSSSDSKNVPPFVLNEICQQRKQKKCLFGTAQVFSRVAKPIREQVGKVYLPKTFLNCLTFVRVTKAEYFNEEKGTFKKYVDFFFFVQTKELRELYDTYEKVQKYKDMTWLQNEYNSLQDSLKN